MINPWMILGVLVLVICAAYGGYKHGTKIERAAWMERENKELAAANAKILKMTKEARDAEQAHASAVNKISTDLQGKADAAKSEVERLKSNSRAGTFRLRDPAAGKDSCGSGTAETGASPGERDGQKGAVISGAATEFLLQLAGEADEITVQLGACQEIIRADRAVR